jgi:hypothetical protein
MPGGFIVGSAVVDLMLDLGCWLLDACAGCWGQQPLSLGGGTEMQPRRL